MLLDGGGEKGGEGVGDGGKKYLWLPGPILMGRGDGGVGGDDDGETFLSFNCSSNSPIIIKSKKNELKCPVSFSFSFDFFKIGVVVISREFYLI